MTKQISPLRQRMIDDMAFRNMSSNTQKVYAYAVANFAKFHPPAQVRSWHLFSFDAWRHGRSTPIADRGPTGKNDPQRSFARKSSAGKTIAAAK
jgi:Phage integrase, N-terminal SAM-like domain